MRLKIGENIKACRKARDITQESLAEMLGVSSQSVSRWELGICYPDMELLPDMARIFDISVDGLLGVDDVTERKKAEQYLARFQHAVSRGEIGECIAVAREGVAEFPNNFALLNKLMYALFISGDEDGNIPEWRENMEKYDDEIVALGERIMKYCPDQSIRLEAVARLAFQHCEMGRKSMGRALYDSLPPKALCREEHIWWGLEEDEKLPFLRDEVRQDYDSLQGAIWRMAAEKVLPDGEAVTALETVLKLDGLICGADRPQNTWSDARLHVDMAVLCARLGEEAKMLAHLKTAAQAAKAFDERPDIQRFSSPLLGQIVQRRTDFETADTRPLAMIMREKWLADVSFDGYRDGEAFRDVERLLSGAIS